MFGVCRGWARSLSAIGVLVSVACQSYAPQPLDPETLLKSVQAERHDAASGRVVSLREAARILSEHNPRVEEARAAYRSATGVAETPTPLPNPAVEVSPFRVNSGEVLRSRRRGIEGSLGWSLLLGGRRKITDQLNAIRADAARIELVAAQREEYLALRGEFAELAVRGRATAVRREIQAAMEASVLLMRRLVDAGQGSALDVRQLELESHGSMAALLSLEEERLEARERVAARIGVTSETVRVKQVADLPSEVPASEALHRQLLEDHPALARLRAAYEVAEKELRLEIARQFPSLDLGPFYEREQGVDKFGLTIGIELPLFDRNQPAIARARGHRDEIRARFRAEVRRRLAAIDVALMRLRVRGERLRILRATAVPAAQSALELARKSLESGTADALQYLSVLRMQQRIRLDVLEAERRLFEAWSDLERACGVPLLQFPEEPGDPPVDDGGDTGDQE